LKLKSLLQCGQVLIMLASCFARNQGNS